MPNVNPIEVRTIMQIQADDIGAIGYDLETGYGRLNAKKCVQNLLDTPDLVVSDFDINFVCMKINRTCSDITPDIRRVESYQVVQQNFLTLV